MIVWKLVARPISSWHSYIDLRRFCNFDCVLLVRIIACFFTSVPCDSMMTTQQSYLEWSILDKSDSSRLISWKVEIVFMTVLASQTWAQTVTCCCRHARQKKGLLHVVSGFFSLSQWSWTPWICSPSCHSLHWILVDSSARSGAQSPHCLWWGSVHTGWHPFYNTDIHKHKIYAKKEGVMLTRNYSSILLNSIQWCQSATTAALASVLVVQCLIMKCCLPDNCPAVHWSVTLVPWTPSRVLWKKHPPVLNIKAQTRLSS